MPVSTIPYVGLTTPLAGTVVNSGTAQASTSGTSIDFTSIPSWVKRITVMLAGVSTNGSNALQIQLGTSSGVVATGYTGYVIRDGAANSYTALSTSFLIETTMSSAVTAVGANVFVLLGSNTWVGTGTTTNSSSINETHTLTGSVALGATLDRVRITTAGSTDIFDAGTINILYE